MKYDGTTRLSNAVADLFNLSKKSHSQLAEKLKAAKTALGITSKARQFPAETNLQIYEWLKAQKKGSKNKVVSTGTSKVPVAKTVMPQVTGDKPVKTISQPISTKAVKPISQASSDKAVKLFSQNESVELFSQVRIAFYTSSKVRQVISLDRFYVDALRLAAGLDKGGVPKWVKAAVDSWQGFDADKPITKQIKFLIIQELTRHIQH